MSLLPSYLKARKRKDDSDPLAVANAVLGGGADSRRDARDENDSQDNVFGLLPPQAGETAEATEPAEPEKAPEPAPVGRNVHPVEMTDLSRLSIDKDGRLYWDGKPVEVRRCIQMSRPQIVGACLIGAFVAIGAIGAAIQGSAAARDWACRLGWSTSYCTLPGPNPLRANDIPA